MLRPAGRFRVQRGEQPPQRPRFQTTALDRQIPHIRPSRSGGRRPPPEIDRFRHQIVVQDGGQIERGRQAFLKAMLDRFPVQFQPCRRRPRPEHGGFHAELVQQGRAFRGAVQHRVGGLLAQNIHGRRHGPATRLVAAEDAEERERGPQLDVDLRQPAVLDGHGRLEVAVDAAADRDRVVPRWHQDLRRPPLPVRLHRPAVGEHIRVLGQSLQNDDAPLRLEDDERQRFVVETTRRDLRGPCAIALLPDLDPPGTRGEIVDPELPRERLALRPGARSLRSETRLGRACRAAPLVAVDQNDRVGRSSAEPESGALASQADLDFGFLSGGHGKPGERRPVAGPQNFGLIVARRQDFGRRGKTGTPELERSHPDRRVDRRDEEEDPADRRRGIRGRLLRRLSHTCGGDHAAEREAGGRRRRRTRRGKPAADDSGRRGHG